MRCSISTVDYVDLIHLSAVNEGQEGWQIGKNSFQNS